MGQEDHLAADEGRGVLAFLICLLLVLGYVALHQLGGTAPAPAVEIRAGYAPESASTPTIQRPREEQPHVLTLEASDPPSQALRMPAAREVR